MVTQVPARPNQNNRRVIVHTPRVKIAVIPCPELPAVRFTLRRLNTRQQIVPNQQVPTTTRHRRANSRRLIRTILQRHPLTSRRLVHADARRWKNLPVLIRLNQIPHLQAERIRQLLRVRRADQVLLPVLTQIPRRKVLRCRKRLRMTRWHRYHQTLNPTFRYGFQLLTQQFNMLRRLQPTHVLNVLRQRINRLLPGQQLLHQTLQVGVRFSH